MNSKSWAEKAKIPLTVGRDGLLRLGRGALTKSLDFVDGHIADSVQDMHDKKDKDQWDSENYAPTEILSAAEKLSQSDNAE